LLSAGQRFWPLGLLDPSLKHPQRVGL